MTPFRKTLWKLTQEGDRERGTMIALLPLDILDYKGTDMKNARLIKRNPLSEQPLTEDHRKADSQPIIDVRKSTMKWVREWQEMRQIDPRMQFAALFRTAS
jgi:hypothetical protein